MNFFKLVPAEPTVSMEDAGAPECFGYCPRCDEDMQIKTGMQVDIYRAMIAAAPQPPALGGEPERLMVSLEDHKVGQAALLEHIESLKKQLQESAALTSHLQAEIERWKACYEEASDKHSVAYAESNALADQVDNLKADLKSAIADKAAYGKNAIDLRKKVDQLKARCDELEGLIRELPHDLRELSGSENTAGVEACVEYVEQIAIAALSKPAGSEKS